jgi:hypothetical protein
MEDTLREIGRAVAQAVSRWLPTAAARVSALSGHMGFVVNKVALGGQVSASTSPANHHSTEFSIIMITRGTYSRPVGGRRAEWTQLDSTPPTPLFEFYSQKCFRQS